MELSDKIRAVREGKRIRQIEIANALELDPSYYAKLEKRGDKMTVEQLEKIASALGVSVGELLGLESQRFEELEKKNAELESSNFELKDRNQLLESSLSVLYSVVAYVDQALTENALVENPERDLTLWNGMRQAISVIAQRVKKDSKAVSA